MAAKTREVLVTNAAGGTRLDEPDVALINRRHVIIVNRGPNAIHVTVSSSPSTSDGVANGLAPTTTTGIAVAANGGTLTLLDCPSGNVIRAIAATAAQAANAATNIIEW